MARKIVNSTKIEIVRVATEMFVNNGYSSTSIKAISDELGISTGHLTFYFPTKEHLLAVLIEMLCDFQWQELRNYVDEGKSSMLAVCLELASMASICEVNPIAKDFFLSAYSQPLPLRIIRQNDLSRAKDVFAQYCPDWTDQQFSEAETLVSGIEYATMMTTEDSAPLEVRIAGAIDGILALYNVPAELRKIKIEKVLDMDYIGIGRQMIQRFILHVSRTNEQRFEELYNE